MRPRSSTPPTSSKRWRGRPQRAGTPRAAVTIAFPRLAAVKDSDGGEMKARMKSLWDNCKETVKGFAEIFSASSDEAVEDLRTMAPAMLALIDLTADFSRRYNEEKRRRNSADFSDQEHEAIRLLIGEDGAPTELARIVSARYREIMVDEYQDTNEVQNRILTQFLVKEKTFSLLAMSSRASIASA